MNVFDWLLWGFVATIVLTGVSAGAQATGTSRMALPFILGTMVTPNRDRAPLVGFLIHVLNGWVFAIIYALAFESLGRATMWLGAAGGIVHSLVVLVAVLPILPGLHPRMASERRGPTPTRMLEPPGFLGLHYGRRTPIITTLAHLIYGAILGAFYTPVA